MKYNKKKRGADIDDRNTRSNVGKKSKGLIETQGVMCEKLMNKFIERIEEKGRSKKKIFFISQHFTNLRI